MITAHWAGTATKDYLPEQTVRRYRVLHDIELGKIWRAGLPEVHALKANHHSPFQKWAQLLSHQINALPADLWTKFYHYRYWISNDNGYGDPADPRANFVTGKDTTAELPRVEALVTGGSMIEGERIGDWVKVKGLHFGTPVTLEFLQAHPQYWVRGVYASATGQPFRMLGHKYSGEAFIHPLIVNQSYDCFIEAWKVREWVGETPPDPLKIYS